MTAPISTDAEAALRRRVLGLGPGRVVPTVVSLAAESGLAIAQVRELLDDMLEDGELVVDDDGRLITAGDPGG